MRLFLAIEIPQKIKEKLEKQLFFLKKQYPQFSWVDKDNFHITIYFFGERDDVDKIKNKIKDLLWNQFVFYLYSFNLDIFVNHRLVLYLNFYREKKIEELAALIKNNFDSYNKSNQKFIPHLTLARGPRSSKQQYFALKKKLNQKKINISFKVDKIVLFESILTGNKPIYKKIASFSLI